MTQQSIAVRQSALAATLNVSARVIRRWMADGMPHLRSNGTTGMLLFIPDEVDAWLRERQIRFDRAAEKIAGRWADLAREVVSGGAQ